MVSTWAVQSPESEDHECGNSDFPFVDTEIVRDQLYQLNVHKSVGPDGIHPRVLKALADVVAGLLSIVYQSSWESGEVPADWKLASVIPIYKGVREDPGNYRFVSLTSVPGKITEKIIQGTIERHLKNNAVIRHSQHGFTKGKSCLTNLMSFYDKVTRLVDEGNHRMVWVGRDLKDHGMAGCLGCKCTLPGYAELLINQHPQVLLLRAAVNPFSTQPVFVLGIALTHVQDLALGLVELHEVCPGPALKPVTVPLDGIPSLQHVDHTTQLAVVGNLAVGALTPTVHVANEDVKQHQSQY
ncbi:hypothetical protein QYF61_003536 [Mycteria americana]|uniref:Reverse transcriptase n=1 Tax=Mycteria americana TaxID=33587 RepID=A0AAN7P2I7_MYCAM|nr:hypothetical protein QYF61_003536 [Mycteria americana]